MSASRLLKQRLQTQTSSYTSGALAVKCRFEEQELLYGTTSFGALRTRCCLGVISNTWDHARPAV